GERIRAGALFAATGATSRKVAEASAGDIVSVAEIETAHAGELLSLDGRPPTSRARPQPRPAVVSYAAAPKDRKDDVRLSSAFAKLLDEDPTLSLRPDPESQQMILSGQGEGHLAATMERLQRRFGLVVATARPRVSYREAVRKAVTQHSRH